MVKVNLFHTKKGVIIIKKFFDFQKMTSREEMERELNRTMEDVQRINVSSTFEFLFESEGGQVNGGGKIWLSAPARDGIIAVAILVFMTAAGICIYVWVKRSKLYIYICQYTECSTISHSTVLTFPIKYKVHISIVKVLACGRYLYCPKNAI